MKRLSYILVLSLGLIAPCVEAVEASPITYGFSAGPVVWTCVPSVPCEGWSPEPGVAGTFTLDDGVLVAFDGHPPGDWTSGSTAYRTEFLAPASIRYRLEEWGWPTYEYSLTFAGLPTGSSSLELVASELVHFNPVLYGAFEAGELHVVSEPVPEPASLLLFGTGLAGLRACRKRRQ